MKPISRWMSQLRGVLTAGTLCAFASQFVLADPNDNLIAHWKSDEGGGIVPHEPIGGMAAPSTVLPERHTYPEALCIQVAKSVVSWSPQTASLRMTAAHSERA